MKIKREEKKIVLVPESEWEYQQLQDLHRSRTECKGFEDAWHDSWSSKGGLIYTIKDPYE